MKALLQRCGRLALAGWLALGCGMAFALHFDVLLRTSNGPVAGSRITTDFFGDLGLAGVLPVDAVTGAKIYPGYFGDLEGGPFLTDDPGFQAFAGTFLRREEIHFRALGRLQHWDPASGRWADAPAGVTVTLYGGIPLEVIVGYTENPAAWQAQYDYYAAGTRFSRSGVEGPPAAVIDDASSSGAFHAHLDWKITAAAGGEPPVGAYMVTLELWSPTLDAAGQPKYLPSEPIQVVFERGITEAQLQAAILARVQPPPPPACPATTLSWLVAASGCSAEAPQTASGASVLLQDDTEPTVGSARFACVDGNWGSATQASCAVPPPRPCAAQQQQWQVDGQSCSGTTAEAASGESRTASDDTGPAVGSAVFACSNGRWGPATQARCAVPPPAACGPAPVSWTVGGATCRAALAAAESGAQVQAVDGEAPETGSATYSCSNGAWSGPQQASCSAPPPPQACAAQTVQWTSGGQACEATLAAAASGTAATAVDESGPAVGVAPYACNDGRWLPAGPAQCSVPPPAACPARLQAWTVGGLGCSGLVPAAESGAEALALDDVEPLLGSAAFACSNGSWGPPLRARCEPPPPPRPCVAQVLGWEVSGLSCSGRAPTVESGASAAVADAEGPALGAALFSCSNGTWGAPQAASCAVPPPRACTAQALSWSVGANSCTAQVPGAASGAWAQARTSGGATLGSARFACHDGQWQLQPEPAALCGALLRPTQRGRPRAPWSPPVSAPWQAP